MDRKCHPEIIPRCRRQSEASVLELLSGRMAWQGLKSRYLGLDKRYMDHLSLRYIALYGWIPARFLRGSSFFQLCVFHKLVHSQNSDKIEAWIC